MTKEKSVRAQIKDLEVGGSARFPLSRYDYIVNCKTRLQFGTPARWTSSIDNAAGEVLITRVN